MDERLKDALASAGVMLAEAVRAGLLSRGLPGDVTITARDGRIVISGMSSGLRDAELGAPGRPPAGIVEGIAREAAPHVAAALGATLRERGL